MRRGGKKTLNLANNDSLLHSDLSVYQYIREKITLRLLPNACGKWLGKKLSTATEITETAQDAQINIKNPLYPNPFPYMGRVLWIGGHLI